MTEGIGCRFQQETKYFPDKLSEKGLVWISKPELYKEYPESKKIKLPTPETIADMSLSETLKKRKSIRSFSQQSITQKQLSYLLWASSGIQRKEYGYEFRTAPSAGALYPIETYLVVNNVEEVVKGVYHYNIKAHILEELSYGDFRGDITRAAMDQEMCSIAALVFIWTAIFNRSMWKYRERAYRYIYLDAGHIAQNLALTATALGLGSCQIGALFDDEVNKIINVDGTEESVIYMSVVGYPLQE